MAADPNTVIIRYGEIFLKSDWVRCKFTQVLRENIICALERAGIDAKIDIQRHRLYANTPHAQEAAEAISRVFGVKSTSPAVRSDTDKKHIYDTALSLFPDGTDSFCVRAKRDKSLPMTSIEIERELGALIVGRFGNPVDLSNPDILVGVEATPACSFVYTRTLKGPGGLPYGSQGIICARLTTGDDACACYLLMRRGCKVVAYGDPKIKSLLDAWAPQPIKLVEDLQQAIKMGAKAFCIGDGIEGIGSHFDLELNVPVFRPLIGISSEWLSEIQTLLSQDRK